jgi:hypothetical protein
MVPHYSGAKRDKWKISRSRNSYRNKLEKQWKILVIRNRIDIWIAQLEKFIWSHFDETQNTGSSSYRIWSYYEIKGWNRGKESHKGV